MDVQPIRKSDRAGYTYLFDDEEIQGELESYHISRSHVKEIKVEEAVYEEVQRLMHEAKSCNGNELMNDDISDCEVSATFSKGSATLGLDGISSDLVDGAERQLMHEYLRIFWNKACRDGYFMTTWKQEHRVILPKPGKEDYNVCNAFRTVSITSCLGKRFEVITA